MAFFLLYWKEFALAAVVIGILWLGYHLHGLQDAAAERDALKSQLAQAQKATPAVIDFTQKFTKAAHDSKDKCLDTPLPPDLLDIMH